jgi:arylsulfatase A-like enzyme/cytochrome c-type biogenesis protein CcmH/NrfG
MKLRFVWLFLFVAGVALSQVAPRPRSKQASAPPDVYLITIDTLRADHVHCFGYDKAQTPAIDSLCRDGVRFTAAFTPSPITNTSHASILTGLLPSVHGVTDFAIPLAPAHATLAELLKKRGYHTAALIGAVILDSKTLAPGFGRGFDFYDGFPEQAQNTEPRTGRASRPPPHWGRVERRGGEVVEHAIRWLTAHPAGPHFVWVHLYDPHDPYEPPEPFLHEYETRPYDGEIAYADSALGKFLEFLKQRGWYRAAAVVLVGDHGEGLGEHNEDTHGIFLYDSTTHVPLVVKLPEGAHAGQVVEEQVRTLDILPTLASIAGADLPGRVDGASLLPLLQNQKGEERPAFGETDYPLRFGWAPLRSLRASGAKFIEAPKPEFYNLKQDPAEARNLYQPWDEKVKEFRARLAELKAALPPPSSSAASVGQGTVEELKALGYLGKADAGSSTDVPEPTMLPDPKDRIEEQNLLHRAMIASEDARPQEARTALEKLLQVDPQSAAGLLQLGQLELESGNYEKAAGYLGRARALRPEDAAAAWCHGQALAKSGDYAGAREALETSLHFTPGQFQARLLLGQVFLKLKEPKPALDQLEAALLLQPANPEARLSQAEAQLGNDRAAEAAATLESLTKSEPKNVVAWDLLARAYTALGKADEARRAEGRAAQLRATTR